MIQLVLVAQLAAARTADSTYSSPAVRELVNAAAARNARMSALLPAYRATAESEFTWIIEDTAARPQSMIAQQHYSSVRWNRGSFDVRVLSERPAFDLPELQKWMGPGWLIPALYGDGFAFVYPTFRRDDQGQRVLAVDTMRIPHPFGAHRETRYRFSGGERQATLHVGPRDIPILRIHVVPVFASNELGAAFEGDVYVDANQLDVVRLRGRLLVIDKERSRGNSTVLALGATIASYVDVTNEEVGGQFWLPMTERVEFQMTSGLILGSRTVMRLSARLDHQEMESAVAGADSTTINPKARVAFAPWDTLRIKRDWLARLGASSFDVRSSDFDDLAPDVWRPDGPPRFSIRPSTLTRLVRRNPVEGWFTGLEGTLAMRDAMPGLTARAFGGWAWQEQVVRGGGALEWRRDGRGLALRAERSLESTNDFETPLPAASAIFDMFGLSQRRDWLDRQAVDLSAFALRGLPSRMIGSVRLGVARDGSEEARALRPFAPKGDSLLLNRAARPGTYRRLLADVELNREVGLRTPVSGFSSALHYEMASGDLAWQRATVSVLRRDQFDDLWFLERIDAGVVAGSKMPPQSLFELGGAQDLSAYQYKQFAGDRAAIGSVGASYLFSATRGWRIPNAPRWIPAIAPGLSAGAQFGWTTLSTAASAAVLELDPAHSPVPISTATNGVRGSGGAGFTLLSGFLHFGVAHAFDSGSRWRWVAGVGTRY